MVIRGKWQNCEGVPIRELYADGRDLRQGDSRSLPTDLLGHVEPQLASILINPASTGLFGGGYAGRLGMKQN